MVAHIALTSADEVIGKDNVVRPSSGPARMNHPQAGELVLHREKLIVAGTDGQTMVVYHLDAETPAADAFALLSTLAATNEPASPEPRPASTDRPTRP